MFQELVPKNKHGSDQGAFMAEYLTKKNHISLLIFWEEVLAKVMQFLSVLEVSGREQTDKDNFIYLE